MQTDMENKNEIRTLEGFVAVREQADDVQGESRTIYGRAIVFDSESELLDDFGMTFREVIKPEAATMDFLLTQDIKLNMLHDRKQTVARWNHGKGSLRLSVDGKAVSFEFEAPRCDLGDRCLEMVRRGDYSGCSFEFVPDKYEVKERGKDDLLITHTKFRRLSALTIGLDPAYTATSVNAREILNREDEAEKQAREAAAAAEAEALAKKQAEEEAAAKAKAEAEEQARRSYEYRKRKLSIDNNNNY